MSVKEKLLVSSCLLGENVKYNGSNNKIDLSEIEKRYEIVSFCPEVEGGLQTPRAASEIVSFKPLKVINIKGVDVTANFTKGAKLALDICKKRGIRKALLKERSPSCGKYRVYDGSFSKNLIKGEGVTAALLRKNFIEIYNEEEMEKLC